MNVRVLAVIAAAASVSACAGGGSSEEQGYDVPRLGTYLDYRVTPGTAAAYTSRTQVVSVAPGSFVRRTTPSNGTGYTENTFVVVDGSESISVVESYAATGALSSTTSYDPAFLMLSADTTPGAVETTVSWVTSGSTSWESIREVTVNGVEDVVVPAGRFQALKTTAHITSSLGSDSTNVNWWVRGVGRVKIMSYPTASPASGTTWELTAHGTAPVP